MKKVFAVLCIAALVFLSCSQKEGDSSGVPTVRYLMPGEKPPRYDDVLPLVNEKLLADKGIRLEITYVPWDVWQQRINLMLATGEEFDVFPIMQDQIQMASFQAMGGLTDITDLLESYGPIVKNVITQGAWDSMRIDGRIYGIPAQWVELSNDDGFTIRKDVLDKFGYRVPESIEELIATAQSIAAKWDGSGRLYIPVWGFTDFSKNPFARTYDSWPFIVKDGIALIRQDGTVDSWIESDEFRRNASYMRQLFQAGLIHPDVLTMDTERGNAIFKSGNWFFTLGGLDSYFDDVKRNNNPDIQPEDYVMVKMNPEKQDIYPVVVKNLNGISSTSKNPEAAIKFFDWLYADQENYNLLMYGRLGEEYLLDGRGFKTQVLGPNYEGLFGHADWMLGNMNLMVLSSNVLPMEIQYLYTPNPNAVTSPASDFFFDSRTVEAEWANMQTEFRASIVPIYAGVVDFDTAFPAAISRMRAAGLEKILAEYQRQLSEHIASKN